MKYSILLVVHNHCDLTKLCLNSIRKYSPAGNYELLILDNASSDGTRDFLREQVDFNNVRIFFNETNQGFMSPMNFLASKAIGDYLVILNNDLQVCPDWLEKMEYCFDREVKVALVGLAQNCGEIGPDGNGIPVKNQLEYIEASCMMLPRAIMQKHGLFDDKYYYFGYYEDSDLSLRLRERGYMISTIGLPIVHRRASTMNNLTIDIDGIRARNSILFCKRWADYLKRRTFEKKVLFRRFSAIGDVIMATAIIEAYKERFPFARITFATSTPWVFENNPHVEKIINLETDLLNLENYDEFHDLDFAYERRPEMNVIEAYAATVGIELNGHLPRLYTAKANGRDSKLAVIHAEPIPGWPGRNAPRNSFIIAAKNLIQRGFHIVEVGKIGIIPDAEYRKTSFPELCALIASASIFVGHDSAPFHVAQTYGVPAVIPFGAVKPEYRTYSNKVFPVIAENVKCLGCHHLQDAPRITQTCQRPKPICMTGITGALMEHGIAQALEEK